MIITLVPMTGVILNQVAITISFVVMTLITVHLTLVTFTLVVPISDTLMSGVLIILPVPSIDVIPSSVNAHMNILNVAMMINVPLTVVTPS
jgi:hypothetical protein